MPGARTYVTGHNRLELDGQDAGLVRSVEGGEPYGEVVQEAATTPGAVVGKHLGPVHFADIAIECSLTPSAPVANWIGATLGRSGPIHDGAIVELDSDFRETSRLTFRNALVHAIEFPALDAADKQQAYLTLRLAPESTRRQAGSGARQAITDNTSYMSAKGQQASNFQLKVDGLTGSFVSKVEPLIVRQVFTQSRGEDRTLRPTPSGLEIPDLVVTLREAADWYSWRDAFMIEGTAAERTGTLEYLASDMGKVLARIEFSGLGIHSLVTERTEERTEGPRRMRASMYCENLRYVPSDALSSTSIAERLTPHSRVDAIAPLASRRLFAPRERA